MSRRWPVLTVAAAVVTAPVLTACGDDDDEGPVDPTVTLFEETINPNVSTDVTT